MTASNVLAIDCDGVLLDYGQAYGMAWARAFGSAPTLVNPNAYWPMDRWGVPRLVGSELDQFRAVFDESFWNSIPAVAGAVEACHQLVRAGFVLVCVTALDDHNLEPRMKNLLDLGFPLSQVIATPHQAAGKSPKADVLNEMRPLAFVDDYAPYMHGVDVSIHKALIVRDPFGSPNAGEALNLVNSTHADLHSFADFWCSQHAACLGPQ